MYLCTDTLPDHERGVTGLVSHQHARAVSPPQPTLPVRLQARPSSSASLHCAPIELPRPDRSQADTKVHYRRQALLARGIHCSPTPETPAIFHCLRLSGNFHPTEPERRNGGCVRRLKRKKKSAKTGPSAHVHELSCCAETWPLEYLHLTMAMGAASIVEFPLHKYARLTIDGWILHFERGPENLWRERNRPNSNSLDIVFMLR